LACPFRRFMQDPARILSPFVRQGMTVLEPGPGMGFFTLELARLVGASGSVIAVDIQRRMIESLRRRAAKRGLLDRLHTRLASADTMGLDDLASRVDFVLAFAVVHEMPSAESFFRQAAGAMKQGASLLFAEPAGHVKSSDFEESLAAAAQAGLGVIDRPAVRRSHAALLKKT
jgi:tRNA A58 N-methylase Trm61